MGSARALPTTAFTCSAAGSAVSSALLAAVAHGPGRLAAAAVAHTLRASGLRMLPPDWPGAVCSAQAHTSLTPALLVFLVASSDKYMASAWIHRTTCEPGKEQIWVVLLAVCLLSQQRALHAVIGVKKSCCPGLLLHSLPPVAAVAPHTRGPIHPGPVSSAVCS